MKTVEQYATNIVSNLKAGKVPDGEKVAVANDRKAKAEAIVDRVHELMPESVHRWNLTPVGLLDQ